MSLLLEALKKAELAKQQQAAQQGGTEDTTLPITSTRSTDRLQETPRLEPLAVTRDRLPEVDAPLELVPDQIPAGDPARGSPLDLALTDSLPQSSGGAKAVAAATAGAAIAASTAASSAPSARAEAKEPRTRSWSQDTADDRESARRIFEAKTPDYNPRRPFYAALGVLGLVAAGALGYFWWELQPRSAFTTASVKSGPRPVAPVPGATTPPQATGAASSTPNTELPAQPQINVSTAPTVALTPAGTDAAPTPAVRAPEVTPTPTIESPKPVAEAPRPATATPTQRSASAVPQPPQPRMVTPQPAARERVAAAQAPARVAVRPAAPRPSGFVTNAAENAESSIRVNRAAPRLDPVVEEAYAAFQSGDIEQSRQLYLRAAQSDPLNRDVQLGLAAVDLRTRNLSSAEARYARLLELDPRDPHALAGITAIRGGADPVTTESRLKTLIAQQPDSGMLHFALGNQLAAQARWNEAQQEYFKAFSSDPENPDFAFNLAVSLDNIRQGRLASDYYKQALTLAERRPAAFDRTRVSARMQELQR